MCKGAPLMLLGLVFAGCETNPDKTAPSSGQSQRVQGAIGEPDGFERGHLAFEITAIRENQQPSQEQPVHKDDGAWTYFDCRAVADPAVVFAVGVESKQAAENVPIAFGQATLVVKDKASSDGSRTSRRKRTSHRSGVT